MFEHFTKFLCQMYKFTFSHEPILCYDLNFMPASTRILNNSVHTSMWYKPPFLLFVVVHYKDEEIILVRLTIILLCGWNLTLTYWIFSILAAGPQIVTTVVPVGSHPTHMICPSCHAEINTATQTKPGLIAYISGAIIFILGWVKNLVYYFLNNLLQKFAQS